MPTISTQTIQHIVSGGWATDYGRTAYDVPQGSTLSIPWLNAAENIQFNNDGSISKFTGTVPMSVPPYVPVWDVYGNTKILNVFDYWRLGSSGSPAQRIVGRVGTAIFSGSSGSFSVIPGANGVVPANTPAQFSQFNDLLIIAVENSAPYSWDQTTFQALAGTPPNFAFSTTHKGRHWASGAYALPNRLYYSAVGNPEDWVGAGSGSIDIDPGDGSKIVGLLSWKNDLWVFKGPYKPSIHRITGSAPTDFARIPFIYGITAAHQNAIFPIGDDFGFWSPFGTCHSLKASANFGDYVQEYLNYPILSWCRKSDNMDTSSSSYWQTATDPVAGYSILMYQNAASTSLHSGELLVMDWKFQSQGEKYPRFSRLFLPGVCSLTYGFNTATSNVPRILFGSRDGLMDSSGADTYAHRVSPFRSHISTPALTYGSEFETKTPSHLSVSTDPVASTTISVSWGGPKVAKQTVTMTPTAEAILGSFIVGTDILGEVGATCTFEQELSGDFRAIQYDMVAEEDENIVLRQFSVKIMSNGTSMETTV